MSTYARLLTAREQLEQAQMALAEITATSAATEAMRDAAYQTVATYVDKVADLTALELAEMDAWYAAGCPDEDTLVTTAPAAFDVPGSITWRQVASPKRDETPAKRAYRLAQKALIEGVHIVSRTATEAVVTSGSTRNRTYRVDLTQPRCTCPAGASVCKHCALVAALDGRLAAPMSIAA